MHINVFDLRKRKRLDFMLTYFGQLACIKLNIYSYSDPACAAGAILVQQLKKNKNKKH